MLVSLAGGLGASLTTLGPSLKMILGNTRVILMVALRGHYPNVEGIGLYGRVGTEIRYCKGLVIIFFVAHLRLCVDSVS